MPFLAQICRPLRARERGCRERQRDAAWLLPEPTASVFGSGLATGKDVLLDNRVDAPISINHLGDAEVDANRN